MVVSVLADVIVGAALVLTIGFGVTAFLGMDVAAAWLAGGLVIAGLARLGVILAEAVTPDY